MNKVLTCPIFALWPTGIFLSTLLFFATAQTNAQEKKAQYSADGISVPVAHAKEKFIEKFSPKATLAHLDDGAIAWAKSYKCVSCHTNGSYLAIRSSISQLAGKPKKEVRDFFVDQIGELNKRKDAELKKGIVPTQLAYIAWSLAEWDANISEKRSPETDLAIQLMMRSQAEDGSFSNAKCWPPLESSNYHGATVAAMACATAPNWLKENKSKEIGKQYAKTIDYLKSAPAPHDYGSLLKLWVETKVKGLMDEKEKSRIIEMIFKHQNKDGGWAMRDFSTPEKWGSGNRAKKLRAEPDFKDPASDGHQTGLCVIVLREAGISADHKRIKKAIHWIVSNQRESGRWWTRSMNTDGPHYITYSGTCYPLAALAKCGKLKRVGEQLELVKD